MKTPDKIYLKVCGCGSCPFDDYECDEELEELEESTWNMAKVFEVDVEYIRKDKVLSIIRGALGPQDALKKINSL